MDQKPQFIADDLRRTLSIPELCALYSGSRTTGDTWIERYLPSGPSGREERSRKPGSSPHQTPQHIVDAFIERRCRPPSWGAKTLLSILHKRHPSWALPGRSTGCDILRRHGLVPKNRHPRHIGHPGQPQQNGRHARLHRPLKAETTRPPARTRRAQQRKFDHFREECNGQRPPETLDLRTPAACDEPSPRKIPNKPPPREYPARFAVRDVSAHGGLRWNHPWGNVSHVCVGAYVGLEDIDEGVWNVAFGPLPLGRLLERHRRIADASGRRKRCR